MRHLVGLKYMFGSDAVSAFCQRYVLECWKCLFLGLHHQLGIGLTPERRKR